MGKTPGKDARSRKATYPAIHGVDATREQIDLVYRSACDALKNISRPSGLLESIANFVAKRET
jgi:geranylgeranyl pyrophosphate synthase